MSDEFRDVKGHVLRFPDGIVGVPVDYMGRGWWRTVVLTGTHGKYSGASYDLHVSYNDIDAAERLVVAKED